MNERINIRSVNSIDLLDAKSNVLLYTASQKKLCHYTFVYNFNKCWPIFNVRSLLYSPRNLQHNLCHIAHHP